MFFILSKILGFISNPLAWVIACLLTSLLVQNHARKRFFTWLTIGLFWFFGNIFFIKLVRRSWDVPAVPIMKLKTYEMGIVLGGGSRIMLSDTNRVALNWAGDRLVQAVQLYKMGKIKKIVFTGGDARISGTKHPEANNVFKFFRLMDIPDSIIILESQSRNTHENAIFTEEILKEKNMLSYPALLITNAGHMRRSLGCFYKAGITCDPFSVDDVTEYDTYSFLYYLIPDQEMFGSWSFILHEWFGYLTYKIKGYI